MDNQDLKSSDHPLLAVLNLLLVTFALYGCGGSDSSHLTTPVPTDPPVQTLPPQSGLPVPDNRTVSEFRVVLLGNSHVSYNNLAGLLKQMLQSGRPQAKVHTETAADAATMDPCHTARPEVLDHRALFLSH